ncbi:MAG TPA: MBL fold metallo-hydrolase [Blastocatellia bacterium]|nr:MBL fold metallo-hydrolase [Blastocatellia bacterium]
MITIQFLGAAQTVTGSKYVLDINGFRVMVDCGLFQGLKELRARNWQTLPLEPASIHCVLLTHAHIDHTGYLPRLVRDGFQGAIYSTRATADLLKIMLPDSARLQEEDAEYANRKGYSKHAPALPLYTEQDARRTLRHLNPVNYLEPLRINKWLTARFIPAGHILGSSFIELSVVEQGREPFKIVFSGDVGRYDEPILNDPSRVEEADYLLVESTYGNRVHDPVDAKQRLAEIINAAYEKKGKVVIPAFAVGRTQLLVYYLRELEDEHLIPVIPVAVDSPMGAEATRLYTRHHEEHDSDIERLEKLQRNPLATRNFSLVQGRAGSKALNDQKGPMVIISASGMATGGRVLHHLEQCLPDPNSTVVFVGFQAQGTRGRRLQEGEKEIKIHGRFVPVNARIESIGSLSAHADSEELMRWLKGFKKPPITTFIVHGEMDGATALQKRIETDLNWKTEVPEYMQVAVL